MSGLITKSNPAAATSEADGAKLDAHSQRIVEVRLIMHDREAARKENNFGKSDKLRAVLLEKYGVEVKDQVGGPSGWKFKDGSTRKLMSGAIIPEQAKKKRDRDEEQEPGSAEKRQKKGRDHSRPAEEEKKKLKVTAADSSAANKKKPANEKESSLAPELQKNKKALAAVVGVTAPKGVQNIQGVLIEDLKIGSGKEAESGKKCTMGYEGRLKSNGKMFDASGNKPFSFRLGRSEVIRGWDIGVNGMREGGKRRLTIPPEKGYGRAGAPPTIPGNATLVFEVTLNSVH